jgi:hypothetical protein
LATGTVTRQCLAAIDAALDAGNALLEHLPALVCERALARRERAAARQRYDEDVDPTNRRGLLSGAAGAALGAAALGPAPAAAREVDPQLPDHWTALLRLLGRHDAVHGARDVLAAVQRELRLIADHRFAARGELRDALMGVEARWAVYAAWLCEDTGDPRGRDALLDRALNLAREADHPDVTVWARARQAQWTEVPRAIRTAEAGVRTSRASPHTRMLCALRAAHAHARTGDETACEQMLATAERLAAQDSPAPPAAMLAGTDRLVRCWEARCWAALRPVRGVALYDRVLRDWPREEARDEGLYRGRLALACAGAGEPDRARAEGRKALAIARTTKSRVAARELKRLGAALSMA